MPKEMKFFDLFDKQTATMLEAAQYFVEIITKPEINRNTLDKMHSIEHRGDENTHTIINTLNESFLTPFDREDIMELANYMDDVIDGIHLITNRMYLYKIENPSEETKKLAEIIKKSVEALQIAVTALRNNKKMKDTLRQCIEINRLENLADEIRDGAISRLLNDPNTEPLFAIKQKEIWETAELVTDSCEKVANVLESILVKNN
jgi:predicted phosphate transport protein (TIGR00153 family)